MDSLTQIIGFLTDPFEALEGIYLYGSRRSDRYTTATSDWDLALLSLETL